MTRIERQSPAEANNTLVREIRAALAGHYAAAARVTRTPEKTRKQAHDF